MGGGVLVGRVRRCRSCSGPARAGPWPARAASQAPRSRHPSHSAARPSTARARRCTAPSVHSGHRPGSGPAAWSASARRPPSARPWR
ncbi:hypothetical protein G6F62_015877 [Rhizopus arrhizus]|nr:hypothetical protein G6F31_020563 [Rhizopus arrhizus]KAG1302566.1 hypothetical protein G6F62_015877 [Rhizopus arrhizus]